MNSEVQTFHFRKDKRVTEDYPPGPYLFAPQLTRLEPPVPRKFNTEGCILPHSQRCVLDPFSNFSICLTQNVSGQVRKWYAICRFER